jgi:hypothetical protein
MGPSLYLIVIAELVRARALVDQLWNRAPYPLAFLPPQRRLASIGPVLRR